jgi:spore coat protein A
MLNRRELLRLGAAAGAAAGAAVLIPTGQALVRSGRSEAEAHGHGAGAAGFAGQPAAITPFTRAMPLLRTLSPVLQAGGTDFYAVTARKAMAEFIPGAPTEVLTFGGAYCGPTIRARTGRRVVIAHTNDLGDRDMAVHLHGGHVASANDGFPTDVVPPGHTRVYNYPNNQPAATMWYHDHAHHLEAENVYRGMSGAYIIEDPAEAQLGLPTGQYDIPIMLRDGCLSADGQLVWVPDDFANRTCVMVNGVPQPYFQVAARRYRFRIINSSNLRTFTLRLGSGEQLTQIASDLSLLPAPVPAQSVRLTPAERLDVVIDFSRYPIGTQLVLEDASAGQVMRFDVARVAPDNSRVPATLRPALTLPTATVTRQVTLMIDLATGAFTVNGQSFDPARVDFTIKRGTTEIWEVHNANVTPAIPHNFHMHLVRFTVLSRNGAAPPATETGWKDTVSLAGGETVRLQTTFTEFTGKYVFHCHMLDHSSAGMMGRMDIVA